MLNFGYTQAIFWGDPFNPHEQDNQCVSEIMSGYNEQ